MTLEIRDVRPQDEQAWRKLWDAYLVFYKVALDPEITALTWKRILDSTSAVSMRVAEVDGELAGFDLGEEQRLLSGRPLPR